ncbi:MAG: hypothetical protein LBH39_08790, partial [Clostridiales Family XIII bacterium]|nr:hypothetical protein [Clostridiales Family XIII bacterium]
MHRVTKKLVPAILIAAMLFTTSLPAAFAAYVPPVQSSSELYLTADGGQNTINITAVGEPGGPDDPEPPSAIYGDLALSSAGPSYLSRDYAQSVRVKVENKTADAIQYYLSAENPYEDIYLNFVKAGSIDEPLTILPYEAQEVELSIFLQDARRPRYSIPVSAFVVIGGRAGAAAESLYNLNFYCNLPNFSVDFTKGGINGASLATEYTIRNTSGTKITDLTLSLGGEAADYVRIEPAVESYEIVPNYAVTVKLIPDLKKIKANNKTLVTGTLIAEGGGGSSNEEISFDTEGKGITVGTIGELGLMQDENPYHDIDMDEGTASFVTSISATGVDFADITARYYEEGNPAKDGVNTADEFYEVVGEIIDPDTGMFDFTMYDAFTYDDGTKSVPVSVRFHTELVPDSSARAMAAGDADTGVVTETYYKDGTLTTKQGAYLSVGDYRSIVNGIAGAGEYLKIVNLDRDIFGSADPGIGQKVFFQIDTSLSGMDLDFMGAYAGPSGLVDFSGVNDIDAFSGSYSKVAQISDSFAFKGVEALGTAADIIEAGESIYKTANVWANPNPSITTEQRVGYTGLQIAKNVNSFVGGTLLAKAGTAIGTAIGDGPGAIIGFFTGYVVSGLLGLVLDHYIDEMDASFGGNSLFANIFGKQCTNRGRVDANFYLPDYGVPADAYITGRMYGGGYVNRTETNYDNYLNGEKIGTSRNSGLTEVVINSLPADKLRPGKKNTVTRDYDTDPGSHSVVADTEIAIIYPPGTEIAYIGDTPASMEEVRLLPDLAVYAENIYLKDEAIIGEPNKVIFNVYNRGSLGAWVEIGASDHTGALYTDSVANGGEYRYIGAFSSAEISFAWTPAQERTDVTVVLENKTVGVHERRADNNSATHTFEARGRAVPEIGAISPAEVALQDSDAGMNLSADLTRADDVVSAYFTLDGAAARYEAAFARNGRALRASAFVPAAALPEGDHTARLVVTYKTGIDGTASKSADGNVKVTKVQDLVFAIDTATIAKPVFQVWELRSYMYLPVSAAITVDGGAPGRYRLAQTKEMYANPDDYYLFVKCDAGILIKKISQLSSPLSLAEPYTLSVDKGEADKISRITIKSLDGRSLPSYAVFTDKESVLLSYDAAPGAQAVPIKFEVGYMASTISDYTEIEGGLAGGGLGVNLDDYVAIYRFGLGQAPADSSFGGYFTTEYAGSKDDYSTRAVYDADKKQLVAMSENWNYEYIERAETLGFIVAIGDTLYIADLTDYSAPIDLDAEKAGYAKITYALDGAG